MVTLNKTKLADHMSLIPVVVPDLNITGKSTISSEEKIGCEDLRVVIVVVV